MTQASEPRKIGEFEGKDVFEVELKSESGVKITFLNYGALVKDWQVPLENGEIRHVVCGFDNFEDYSKHSPYFGAIVGRVANRIGGSKFTINGKEYKLPANEGQNHLHGGSKGLGKKVWEMKVLNDDQNGQAIQFSINSSDGEMGYPGNLKCTVTYRLSNYRLQIQMEAKSDAETPVNLTQHNYFNLMNDGQEIKDHSLWINARETLLMAKDQIPTGEIAPVLNTTLDFTTIKRLQNENGEVLGLDNSLVLNKERNLDEPAAILKSADNKLELKMWSDQPSIHVYTSGGLKLTVPGLNNQHYPRFGAICLEDQNFPDAINHSNFPNSIIRPNDVYKHFCEIEIKPSK